MFSGLDIVFVCDAILSFYLQMIQSVIGRTFHVLVIFMEN